MDIRVKITSSDVTQALERHRKGFTLESPLTVALERSGYKGAIHSTNLSWPYLWTYDLTGAQYLRVAVSKRLQTLLGLWWRRKLFVVDPRRKASTFILRGDPVLNEPHFPGYSQEGKAQ